MNKALLALAASLALAAPLAAPASAWAEGHHGRGGGDGGYRGGDRDDGDGRGSDRRGNDGRGNDGRSSDGRGYGYGGDRRGGDRGERGGNWNGGGPGPDYRGQRWDDRRNNGYWMNNRWHYGPPPQEMWGRPGFSLGFSDWRRGGYLPPYYRGWTVDDYGRWGLRRPPYGYHWVRVGDDYLLVATATGLIFDVVRP